MVHKPEALANARCWPHTLSQDVRASTAAAEQQPPARARSDHDAAAGACSLWPQAGPRRPDLSGDCLGDFVVIEGPALARDRPWAAGSRPAGGGATSPAVRPAQTCRVDFQQGGFLAGAPR